MELPQDSYPVIIIGGGLAGLTASAHLAERGIPPLLLDSDNDWTGGRLAGGDPDQFIYQGREWSFPSEHGVHAMWGNYVNLRATLERFTQSRLQPSYGEEWINRWGKHVRRIEAGNAIRSKWIPAPFHYLQLLFHPHIWSTISPWDFLSLPGLLVSIGLTLGVDPFAERKAWDGLLMREYFRGWTPNLRATFTGLGVNLLAAPESEIDLSAFIASLRFYTMLRRDSWNMWYFEDNAHTSVVEPLVNAIELKEGRVWRGMTVTQLAREGDVWRVTADDSPAQRTRTFRAQHVILATHPPATEHLLKGSPDTAEFAQSLRFPSALNTTTARLWFSKSPREGTQGGMMTGDFLPDNFFWIHRLQPHGMAWHEATGGSMIELHLYLPAEDWHLPDMNLLAMTVTDVYRAFPELKQSFVYGSIRRNSKTQTRLRIPTDNSLFVTTPIEGLFACGDWIGYDTPSLWMERAVVTGIASANEVLARYDCPTYPIIAPPAPEAPARWIGSTLRFLRSLFS